MSEATTIRRQPTSIEAVFFAQGLELQIPGEVVLGVIDPEILPDCLPDVADRWMRHQAVRAARFDLRAWMEQSPEARMQQGLVRAYNAMAWFLVQTNLVDATGAVLVKALKFIEMLERRLAGTAMKPMDEATKFWQELQARKAPPSKGGRATTIGVEELQ